MKKKIILCLMASFLFILGAIIFIYGDKSIYLKTDQSMHTMKVINALLSFYKKEKNRYPNTEEGLQAIFYLSKSGDSFYIDPWGNPYMYISPHPEQKQKDSFLLYSMGANKIDEKGKGDDIVCCSK